jgi:ferredoxin--NADP+ reductase
LIFHFCLSPERLEGETGRVRQFVFRRNALRGNPFEQNAAPTEDLLSVDCGLVFGSIGYRGRPMERVPFDFRRGVVPNRKGRVECDGTVVDGLYVTGWLKRGPTGIIGTNRADSIETVQQILEDLPSRISRPQGARRQLVESISRRNAPVIGLPEWLKIDAAECAMGRQVNKPREKFTRVTDMIDVVSQSRVGNASDSHGARVG